MHESFMSELSTAARCIDGKAYCTEAEAYADGVVEALMKKFYKSNLAFAEMLARIDTTTGYFTASTNDIGIDLFLAQKLSRHDIVAELKTRDIDYAFDINRGFGWLSIKIPAEPTS